MFLFRTLLIKIVSLIIGLLFLFSPVSVSAQINKDTLPNTLKEVVVFSQLNLRDRLIHSINVSYNVSEDTTVFYKAFTIANLDTLTLLTFKVNSLQENYYNNNSISYQKIYNSGVFNFSFFNKINLSTIWDSQPIIKSSSIQNSILKFYNNKRIKYSVNDSSKIFELYGTEILENKLIWKFIFTKDDRIKYFQNNYVIGNKYEDSISYEYHFDLNNPSICTSIYITKTSEHKNVVIILPLNEQIVSSNKKSNPYFPFSKLLSLPK